MNVLDPRKVFSKFATGVCILLYKEDFVSEYRGLTINSFASLSLDPLLATFSLKTKSKIFSRFKDITRFSINVLTYDQIDLAKLCSKGGGSTLPKSQIKEGEWPSLLNNMATFYCMTLQLVESGDHTIFICNILEMACSDNPDPLVFFNSQFMHFPLQKEGLEDQKIIFCAPPLPQPCQEKEF